MVVRASKQKESAAARRGWRIGLYSLFALGIAIYGVWFYNWHTHETQKLATLEQKLNQPPVYITLGDTRLHAPVFASSAASNVWYMTNKSHPIHPKNYTPHDLVAVPLPTQPQLTGEETHVRAVVARAIHRLDTAAKQANVPLIINSAYRSYSHQEQLITESSSSLYDTGTRTAPAGASEHQLGLAVDFSSDTAACRTSANCALQTNDATWLATHAHEYGFILRYPEHKETITGYEYEPWHYRYVGKSLASALYTSGLTLDEAWPELQRAEQELRKRGEL